jgi:hypothetical protein
MWSSAAPSQILQGVRRSIGDERACRFIEQLWQYDQIVFDATA